MSEESQDGVVRRPTIRLALLASFVNAFGILQYGYPMGALNLTAELVESFINESYVDQYKEAPTSGQIAAFYGIANNGFDLGAVVGSVASGFIADRFGRKFSVFLVPSIISIISALLYVASFLGNAYEALLIGRIFSGISGGMACIAVPVYLNEFSPIAIRGLINGWHTVVSQSWSLVAMGLGTAGVLGTWYLWPLLLSLPAIPALFMLASTFVMPETPPYTYVYRNNAQKAKELIRKYHGSGTDYDEVSHRFEMAKRLSTSSIGLRHIFADVGMKKGFIVAQVLGLAMALSGQTIVNHFSTTMFETAGLPASQAENLSMVPTGIMILSALVVPTTVDRLGRRPLYLISLAIQFVGIGIYIIFSHLNQQWAPYVSIIGACFCAMGYSVGTGPITLLYSTELVPIVARATVAKYCISTMFFASFAVGLLFSVANDAIGSYSLLPLCTVPQIIIFTYLYLNLPETKGKTSMEVYKELNGNGESGQLLEHDGDDGSGYNSLHD